MTVCTLPTSDTKGRVYFQRPDVWIGGLMTTALEDPELYVEQWRILQFTHLGFTDIQVAAAIVDGIDYHDAAALINRGCDIDNALSILRG